MNHPSFFTLLYNFWFSLIHPFLSFLFKLLNCSSMAPKRNLTRSSIKSKKGETSKSLMQETPTPFISSPLTSLEVPKNWFENHTAFGRSIDTFKHRLLSYVDVLNYKFFFEDFEFVSWFMQTTPGKLLDPGFVTYPILVKIFYCNFSFIVVVTLPQLTHGQ